MIQLNNAVIVACRQVCCLSGVLRELFQKRVGNLNEVMFLDCLVAEADKSVAKSIASGLSVVTRVAGLNQTSQKTMYGAGWQLRTLGNFAERTIRRAFSQNFKQRQSTHNRLNTTARLDASHCHRRS